jgi:lysine 6-dehydrogenase
MAAGLSFILATLQEESVSFTYAVLGAGRQGVAAAYDMIRFGDARAVVLADLDEDLAAGSAERVNRLTGSSLGSAARVDVTNARDLAAFLEPVDALLSAVPYAYNRMVARACIESGTHMCDLGGNTDVVWSQLALNAEAQAAGISIVPDCGLQPGMGNTLAVHAMGQMSDPREVRIWVGGLAQQPRPPFDFLLTFNVEGLTNEYDEMSIVIQDGARVTLPAFEGLEEIEFPPPAGRCEAFLTTGGTSTCPWTFEGKLRTYIEKTVRYPGHMTAFRAFRNLGLFGRQPVQVGEAAVAPRDLYHALLQPRIDFPGDRDLVVLRVQCDGEDQGRAKRVTLDLMDFHDPETGFRAMERATGWPAAIVAQMQARGQVELGAVPLERAVPPAPFLAELRTRGFALTETITSSGPL